MVSKRIFQAVRRIGILSTSLLALATPSSVVWAQETESTDENSDNAVFETSDAYVIDLRPGANSVRAPSREAFVEALGEHGEIRLGGDAELRATLARAPYSAILEQGKATLLSAALAYASSDCLGTRQRAAQATLDLAAASAAGIDTMAELRQAYLYRFLCAHKSGQVDRAMAAAEILTRLNVDMANPDGRPPEISQSTWDAYPVLDARSGQRFAPVTIESDPPGASIWVDFERRGTAPSNLLLSAGDHIVALGSSSGAVSQRITVSGSGTVKLPLQASKRQWIGVAQLLEQLREAKGVVRQEAMRDLMAAVEGQIAFVMREPGRIAVWVLPPGRRGAQHVGHAPGASIAGRLALEALEQSTRSPGLNPNMPLLTEDSESTTRSSSNRRWWIYGVVLGAAAVGAGFIVAQDLSEDRQRIEVSLP